MNDENRLGQALTSFRAALPDFRSFEDPGETFAHEELNDKRELSGEFRALGDNLVAGAYEASRIGWVHCGACLVHPRIGVPLHEVP